MRKRRLTIGACALALALAGCGGGNGGDESDRGNTGPATTDVPRTGTISPETGEDARTDTDDD